MLIRHRYLLPGIVLLAAVLGACAAGSVTPGGSAVTAAPSPRPSVAPAGPAVTAAPVQPGADSLRGTRWVLVSIGQGANAVPLISGSNVTLQFDEGGKASGSGGCNSFGGDYRVQGNAISFGNLASTLRACADNRITQQEGNYLKALGAATRYEISGPQLTISGSDPAMGTLNLTASS